MWSVLTKNRHQWIFVTDTTDATSPFNAKDPEAIMDRFTELLSEHYHGDHNPGLGSSEVVNSSGQRRPRLIGVKSLNSLYQLQPFFFRASIDIFEEVYEDVGVDWEAIENGFIGEIFGT
jgi:hypothetical protein